jgi:hypothetical protein
MAQAVPLLWLLLGASLFGVITRVAIPRNQFHIHMIDRHAQSRCTG